MHSGGPGAVATGGLSHGPDATCVLFIRKQGLRSPGIFLKSSLSRAVHGCVSSLFRGCFKGLAKTFERENCKGKVGQGGWAGQDF